VGTPKVENAPFTGKISGRDKVAEFFTSLDEHEEMSVFEPTEFIAQGNKVVVLGHYTTRVKSTNKQDDSGFAHIVTVSDGNITGFYEFFDTAAAEKAYAAATATQARVTHCQNLDLIDGDQTSEII